MYVFVYTCALVDLSIAKKGHCSRPSALGTQKWSRTQEKKMERKIVKGAT